MNRYLRKLFLYIFILFLLTPFLTTAITFSNPLTATSFIDLIEKLSEFIFLIAIFIVPILIIIAGFYFLTSGGDPQKVSQAKKILLYTIIGLVVVLLNRGIVLMIVQTLGIPSPSQTCVELGGMGCCDAGQICASGEITGASDCVGVQCCGDVTKCEPPSFPF